MKKELNSRSRRKWIITGALSLGAVALVSTGFATWVIGNSKDTGDTDVKLSVDTAENDSVIMTIDGSTSSVHIGETKNIDSGIVVVKDAKEDSMKFTLPTITIQYGKNHAKPTALKFEISSEANKWNKVVDSKKEYIEAPKNLEISESENEQTDGNFNTITLTNKQVMLQWGSAFENKSPANYYNDKYKADATNVDTINTIQNDLNAFTNAVKGKTLKITISLVYEEGAAQ